MNNESAVGIRPFVKRSPGVPVALLAVTALLFSSATLSQDATDRAGDIKLWRSQCNDADPDLRTAYVEEAIETKGTTIKRICVRLAMESSDDDVRNLGLRAAIAMQRELRFKVEMPPELSDALSKARDDQGKLNDIDKTAEMRIYQIIKSGLTFGITDAEVATDRSVWFPYGSLSTPNDNYKGPASIVGDEITWVGNAYFASGSVCRLTGRLDNGARLVGELQCDSHSAFPVSARLL